MLTAQVDCTMPVGGIKKLISIEQEKIKDVYYKFNATMPFYCLEKVKHFINNCK